mgnify:CR=1 FL=1
MSKKTKYAWNSNRIQKSPFPSLQSAKETEKRYMEAERKQKGSGQKTIGFSYTSSLKSMGRIPRSDGSYKLGEKYKNSV